jgi:hypothetical protein
MRTIMLAMAILGANAAAIDTLPPWSSKTEPGDVPKNHVEHVAGAGGAKHSYTVIQGGTMDGQNCRSPLGVGMNREGVCDQTWESNRFVRMENAGDSDVINPWLSNGRNSFRNFGELLASAVTPGMSDKEKALALWFQEIQFRYHAAGDNQELGDPVKVFNSYGHNTCGNDSICLAGLWQKAGLQAAPARGVGHCITQVFYQDRWHLLDGDQAVLYLLRDNETIAGEQDIVRDHDLIRRTHTSGITLADNGAHDEWEAALYGYEGEVKGQRHCYDKTTMNMILRPGEALIWRWGHLQPVKYHGATPIYPDTVCNGLWEYRPDFTKVGWRKGAARVENIQEKDGELSAEPGKNGLLEWTVQTPYVIVGGRLEVEGTGAKFAISSDGKNWKAVAGSLDQFFSPADPARYEYHLRCELPPEARLKRLGMVNDLQMSPLVLPAMSIGENTFVYSDETKGERNIVLTHGWVERSSATPPPEVKTPLFPTDGGETSGTDVAFRWAAPTTSDGAKIADYHFELSDRPDMKWPLSTNFYKLISRTADRGQAQYTLPSVGLLAPDHRYYWRVRAKNSQGVWGSWSKVWSFTPHAPSYPLAVNLVYDPAKNEGVLHWKPNPAGRPAVKYRVYGSDEKGFSASDVPYQANIGATHDLAAQFPANFIAETSDTELAVLGPGIKLSNANKTYYRVTAVDVEGKRSGPSDYASAPRPVIYSEPPLAARVGGDYQYQPQANRSLGDLKAREVDGREVRAFFEMESPKYTIVTGPEWLKLDPATGMLSGRPVAAGKYEVSILATIEREQRKVDESALVWGNYKVLGTAIEKLAGTPQRFTIDVAP